MSSTNRIRSKKMRLNSHSKSNYEFIKKNKVQGPIDSTFFSKTKNGISERGQQNNTLLNKIRDVMIFHNNYHFNNYSLQNENETIEETPFHSKNKNKNLSNNNYKTLSPLNLNFNFIKDKNSKEISSYYSGNAIINPIKMIENLNGNFFVYNLKIREQSDSHLWRIKSLQRNQSSKIMKRPQILAKIDSEENIKQIVNNLKNIYQTNDNIQLEESNSKEIFNSKHNKIIESPFSCLSIDQRESFNKGSLYNNFEENFLKTTYTRKPNPLNPNKFFRKTFSRCKTANRIITKCNNILNDFNKKSKIIDIIPLNDQLHQEMEKLGYKKTTIKESLKLKNIRAVYDARIKLNQN